MGLKDKKCVPCEGGLSPLAAPQVQAYLKDVQGWNANAEHTQIFRDFRFKNFAQSLAFVNHIGAVAEEENHHPDISFGWGYCKVVLQTHSIHGLHENDFIVAAKINSISA